jgi:hypothetical protein
VPHRDDEVPAGEAHHLTGFDDLAGRREFGVLDVVDRLEDGEQRVVVPFQLGPLVCVDGVLDGQRVQPELRGDTSEFGFRRLVQADPGEAAALAHPQHRLVRGLAGRALHPLPVAVDRAVDDGAGDGRVAGGVVRAVRGVALAHGRADRGTQVTDHRHGWLLHGEAVGEWRGTARNGDVMRTSAKRAAPRNRGDGVRYRQGSLQTGKTKCSSVVRNAMGPVREGLRSQRKGVVRKSGWYCMVDFDPPQPHLLRPVPRGG